MEYFELDEENFTTSMKTKKMMKFHIRKDTVIVKPG